MATNKAALLMTMLKGSIWIGMGMIASCLDGMNRVWFSQFYNLRPYLQVWPARDIECLVDRKSRTTKSHHAWLVASCMMHCAVATNRLANLAVKMPEISARQLDCSCTGTKTSSLKSRGFQGLFW
jgi:hypothetical protein